MIPSINQAETPPPFPVGRRVIVLGSQGQEDDVRVVVRTERDGCELDRPYNGKTFFYYGQLGPAPGPGSSGAP